MFGELKSEGGLFDAKLTYEGRCVVRALHRTRGISFKVLASAFGVDDSAIQKMCNKKGKPYESIKIENNKLGDAAFYAKYVKPEYEAHIAELIAATATEKRTVIEANKARKLARIEAKQRERREARAAKDAKFQDAVARALAKDSTNQRAIEYREVGDKPGQEK